MTDLTDGYDLGPVTLSLSACIACFIEGAVMGTITSHRAERAFSTLTMEQGDAQS